MRKKPAPEGTVFIVPLRDNGFAVGVIARTNGTGICFGYFFGPRLLSINEVNYEILFPENAILVGKFGDLELIRGNWKVVGQVKNWRENRWKISSLARIDESAGKAWLSHYDDTLNFLGEEELPVQQACNYPYDRLMGAGSVEIRLTKLL